MKNGTIHDIDYWVYPPGRPLYNRIFSDEVDLSPLTKAPIMERREVVSCIFEGDVVWETPRIAEMCPKNYQIDTKLVFRACTFKKPINWAKCLFTKPIVFFLCRFEGCVDFTQSCFYGASFEDCTFCEKVFFEDAAFLPSTGAESAHCHNSCPDPIGTGSQCNQSDCANDLNRRTERTHCANFRTTVFRDGVEFDSVRFDVPACFYKAEFHGATTFLQSGFGLPAADTREPRPASLNFSYTEIFGSVEFHQGLMRKDPLPLSIISQEYVGQGPLTYREFPPQIHPPQNGGDISDEEIRVDMRYVHIHKTHGLRLHSENLERCLVLGTNLEACHFTNVRWPMVGSYFPMQFKISKLLWQWLGKRCFEGADSLNLKVQWWSGFGNVRNFCCGVLIGPFHLVQSFIAVGIRIMFRWMVRHDTPGNRQSSNQSSSWVALVEYLRSCAKHEQHGFFDHKEQIQAQEKLFPSRMRMGSQSYQPISDQPLDLYKTIKEWRGKWTQLSRAYRDLKAAYEENKDYIYASDFHFAEKELRRINHEVPRHTRFQLQLYWLVSGYGERVLRPIWWFLAIWLLGALPYYLWGPPPENQKVSISVQTTAKANCEPQLRQCDRATQTESSERDVSSPEQAVEPSP